MSIEVNSDIEFDQIEPGQAAQEKLVKKIVGQSIKEHFYERGEHINVDVFSLNEK